jgi:hypothetical protein
MYDVEKISTPVPNEYMMAAASSIENEVYGFRQEANMQQL